MNKLFDTYKDYQINYNEDRKEVESIQFNSVSVSRRIRIAVYNAFIEIWRLKAGIIGGLTAGLLIRLIIKPRYLNRRWAGLIGITLGIITQIAFRLFPFKDPYFQFKGLNGNELGLLTLERVREMNRIFLLIMKTSWGKAWLELEKPVYGERFHDLIKRLMKGTCKGQTIALIKLMENRHLEKSSELIKRIEFKDIIKNQMLQGIACDLKAEIKKINSNIFEESSKEEFLKHIIKSTKLHFAANLAFHKEETLGKNISREAKHIDLIKCQTNKQLFKETLEKELLQDKFKNSGKILAGNLVIKSRSFGHSIFVQFNGHYRFYDIMFGFYECPTLPELIAKLYQHLQKYQPLFSYPLVVNNLVLYQIEPNAEIAKEKIEGAKAKEEDLDSLEAELKPEYVKSMNNFTKDDLDLLGFMLEAYNFDDFKSKMNLLLASDQENVEGVKEAETVPPVEKELQIGQVKSEDATPEPKDTTLEPEDDM